MITAMNIMARNWVASRHHRQVIAEGERIIAEGRQRIAQLGRYLDRQSETVDEMTRSMMKDYESYLLARAKKRS